MNFFPILVVELAGFVGGGYLLIAGIGIPFLRAGEGATTTGLKIKSLRRLLLRLPRYHQVILGSLVG